MAGRFCELYTRRRAHGLCSKDAAPVVRVLFFVCNSTHKKTVAVARAFIGQALSVLTDTRGRGARAILDVELGLSASRIGTLAHGLLVCENAWSEE